MIEVAEDDGWRHLENLPHWFNQLSHLDQLFATWEGDQNLPVAGSRTRRIDTLKR